VLPCLLRMIVRPRLPQLHRSGCQCQCSSTSLPSSSCDHHYSLFPPSLLPRFLASSLPSFLPSFLPSLLLLTSFLWHLPYIDFLTFSVAAFSNLFTLLYVRLLHWLLSARRGRFSVFPTLNVINYNSICPLPTLQSTRGNCRLRLEARHTQYWNLRHPIPRHCPSLLSCDNRTGHSRRSCP